MDIYMPAGAGPFPVVVLIHGSAFLGGSASDEASNAAKYKITVDDAESRQMLERNSITLEEELKFAADPPVAGY